MKRIPKWRAALTSLLLATALVAGLCITASAFTYPSSYWPLQDKWIAVSEGQDADQILSVAGQTYDLLRPYGLNESVCYNLEPKCGLASWACEVKGDLDGAIQWLERQLELDDWLDANVGGYHDSIINNEARMAYLLAARDVTVYAQSDNSASPYSVGPARGTWYGIPAGSPHDDGCASLIYMEFGDSYGAQYWIDYYKKTSDTFRRATEGGVIEFAWNFTPTTAGCREVLSADSHIDQTLRALGGVDSTVLLRVGAEMNNWPECDPSAFIQAFQKIATAARRYDNIQMVFSPDCINNRTVTAADYYPGDAYVDWVGMSVYHRTNYAGYGGQPSRYAMDSRTYGNNAYYGTGIYDYDPLVGIGHIVELARAHGKPVMISECGFPYWNGSQDTTDYAVDQVNKFYSYVNMVYPEVKAVFYFDVGQEVAGEQYHYGLRGNSAVKAAYDSAIAANGAYLDAVDGAATGWEPLSQTRLEETGTLKLATYAAFPGVQNATVRYYVDGALAATSTKAPYYCELDTAALGAGDHTVHVVASGNQFSRTSATYTLSVPGTAAPAPDPEPAGQTPSGWAAALVAEAEEKGLITGRTAGVYHDQITRLQFAELAVNLIEQVTGQEVRPGGDAFTDTDDEMALKAVAAGVASGKGEGLFAPDDRITRQEICVMLNRVIEYVDAANGTATLEDTSGVLYEAEWNDLDQIAGWAVESMANLVNNGLMAGKSGGLAPRANTTVEEAIVLILAQYNKF